MKTYKGSGGISPRILHLTALGGGEWSASRPDRFTPREFTSMTDSNFIMKHRTKKFVWSYDSPKTASGTWP
jgi:hypothetical protein